MVPLLVLSVALVVGAVVLVVLASRSSRRAARLTAVATSTCAELVDEAAAVGAQLGRAALRREVELKGVGAPVGPPLVGPFSGQPVLWYSATVTHHFWKTTTSTDSQGRRSSSRTRATEVLSTETSDTARVLLDDGTGGVQVALRGAEVDGARVLHDQMTEGGGDVGPSLSIGPFTLGGGSATIGYEHVEHALVAGEALYVCGTALSGPAGSLEVVGTEDAPLVVSTRSEEQLVRSAVRKGQWLSAGAVAAGLGAVAAGVGAFLV